MADDVEVVDLVDNDSSSELVDISPDPISSFTSPSAREVRAPVNNLKIESMFGDADDDEKLSLMPKTAPTKNNDLLLVLNDDESDESDEEILKLLAEKNKNSARNERRLHTANRNDSHGSYASGVSQDNHMPMLENIQVDMGDVNMPDMACLDDVLYSTSAAEKEEQGMEVIDDQIVDDVQPDMLADDDGEYIRPSLYQGEAPAEGVAAEMSNDQMMELYNLNKLSSDASEEMPTPTEMSVVLLKHQRQALAWMCHCEENNKPPGTPRGGILADDQGFGKTLSMIALLLTNRPSRREGQVHEPAWGNLIVTPTSIMQQWAAELESRVMTEFKPRVLIYHGHNRPRDPYVLVTYDVVITSYGMLKQEYPKVTLTDEKKNPLCRRKKGPLYKLKWYRIVLDEAQAIKNHRAEAFRAALELATDRRWSLTGTPIQNTIDDIYSQFLWLRYFVVDSYTRWVREYKRPLEGNRRTGQLPSSNSADFKRFQVKLGVVLLRRAKHDKIDGRPVIELPKRTVTVAELQFTSTERAYYQAQELRAVRDMNRFGIEQGFTTALVILLRLRQSCGHPALCDWGSERQFEFSDDELDIVDVRMRTRCLFHKLPADVQNRLAIELGPGSEVAQSCPICMDVIEVDGIVTKCGHIFCKTDFEAWNQNNGTCPTCRTEVGGDQDKMSLAEVTQEVHAIARAKERAKSPKPKEEKKAVKAEPTFRKIELRMGGKREASPPVETPRKRARTEAVLEYQEDTLETESNEVDNIENNDAISEKAKASKTSTKITYFISECKRIFETTDDKVLCFSQWTRMLDLVQVRLNEEGFEYVRLDGKMSPGERSRAVRMFNQRSKCRLFLISLQAGSTGLNLTAANRVYLLDSWWNPAVEDQAIDRVHRIGQTKDVEVVRVKIADSVEDRILALQQKKRAIIEGALGVEGLKTMGRRRLTMQDVLGLFQDVAQNVANRARDAHDTDLQDMAEALYWEGQGNGRRGLWDM